MLPCSYETSPSTTDIGLNYGIFRSFDGKSYVGAFSVKDDATLGQIVCSDYVDVTAVHRGNGDITNGPDG